jgi:cell division protein FtsB
MKIHNNNSLTPRPKNKYFYLQLAIILFLIGYFSYHLISGSKEINSLVKKEKELDELQTKYQGIKLEKLELETKIEDLNENNPNLDLIDELARKNLGFIKKGESVIFEDTNKMQTKD